MYGQVTDVPNASDDLSSSSSSISATSSVDNLTLYIVFGVAFLVFIAVIIVIVRLLKRKSANPNGYTLTSTGNIIMGQIKVGGMPRFSFLCANALKTCISPSSISDGA
jgi:hypothetical protein